MLAKPSSNPWPQSWSVDNGDSAAGANPCLSASCTSVVSSTAPDGRANRCIRPGVDAIEALKRRQRPPDVMVLAVVIVFDDPGARGGRPREQGQAPRQRQRHA